MKNRQARRADAAEFRAAQTRRRKIDFGFPIKLRILQICKYIRETTDRRRIRLLKNELRKLKTRTVKLDWGKE